MQGKTIVLGVSGGIAAYKACELASRLTQAGATVHVVMTASAQRFVTPLTFQALTHQPVHTSLWPAPENAQTGVYAAMPHIGLADRADVILIAPASANTIARLAHGMADDLLSTLVLATHAPVLISPAMNPTMLAHPATQDNLARLGQLGYQIIDPETGHMACEHVGTGRLPTTEILMGALQAVLGATETQKLDLACDVTPARSLAGKKVLITGGPTREPLDPVRYISNRSSGKMGYSLAAEAASRGAEVILVSGPSQLPTPTSVQRIDVTTTDEMFAAVTQHAPTCDIIIAAAAPADFKPATPTSQKIKKRTLPTANLKIELVPTPDIIEAVARHKKPHQVVVAFAAETQDVVAEAQHKLTTKAVDAVVANDVSQHDAGFDVETNRVTWITKDTTEEWPLLNKREVAARILSKIINHLE
ncbi:MAG: bifunctional phosphopantothenoylcysteine decarboxylase/phosphopantothenate--cysteine ligase CoaBC [Abitibacteriaceae bacterium]|nr:bifunctional phosphopantothenoylcysteine decarboxylase/phosphopantothenate--cysteine ligase CoaBC [Abditibacteriaceae bacterium]